MRKLCNIGSTGIFCFLFYCMGFSQITFEKTYDVFPFLDYSKSVQQTADGGYMVSGYGQRLTFDWDLFLIKTDANGDTMWVRSYGGGGQDEGGYARQTSDGGYIITGAYDVGGQPELWLIKTDVSGNIEWDTMYASGPWFDGGTWVEETIDGGYIITGHRSWSGTNNDVWLIKTDSAGTMEWDKYFGGADREVGMMVQQTTDTGYVIVGRTRSFGAGDYDVYLIKTDSAGNTQWTKTYGGVLFDDGWDVKQTTDGGYIISARSDNSDMWIIKTDASGDTVWTKTVINSVAPQIIQTTDGGYAALSGINNGPPTDGDMYLIKMDGSGNIMWTRSYSNDSLAGSPETGWAIEKTSDGGFILAGETGSPGSDVYLVKTDSLGYIDSVSVGINSNWVLVDEVRVYPNPARDELFISSSYTFPVDLVLYNIAGIKVLEQSLSSNGMKISVKHLSKGIYSYRIFSEKEIGTGKLVVE